MGKPKYFRAPRPRGTLVSTSEITRSRWRNWNPPGSLIRELFRGLEAAPELDPEEQTAAVALLNRTGVRIMALEGGPALGLWRDVDGPDIRADLCSLGLDRMPVRDLGRCGYPHALQGATWGR